MAFLRLIVLAPVAVIIVMLAMANRAPVALSFDLTGSDAQTLTVPLFVALLGAGMIGIIVGGVGCWLGQSKHRKAARQAQREAEQARAEVQRLKAMLPAANGGITDLPAAMIR